MTADTFLFWFLAAVTLISGLTVILIANPIFSALALVMTMVGVSALFFTLNAFFLACVQLVVYAGAVMVLFVMVLMLFDLKKEVTAFSRGLVSSVFKVGAVSMLAGLIVGAIYMSTDLFVSAQSTAITFDTMGMKSTKEIGTLVFTKYLFGFEALGLLLLVVAIGAVALARSKGGTHAKH